VTAGWLAPTLRTRRLLIRPFSVADLDAVHAYARAYPAERYGSWLGGNTPSDVARYIADTVARYGRPPRCDLGVTMDAKLVGGVAFRQVWVAPTQLEVGWVIHPQLAGQGVASEAVTAVLDHIYGAFPDMIRAEARVRADDTAGHRILEGQGFVREGVLRHGGGDVDADLFGLLRHERVRAVAAG